MRWHYRGHAVRWLRALGVEENRSIGLGSAHTVGEIDEVPAEASAGVFAGEPAVSGFGWWSGTRHTERHTDQGSYLGAEAPEHNIAHFDTQATGKRRN